MWVLLLPFGHGIERPCLDYGARWCGRSEVGVPPPPVRHGVKGEAMASEGVRKVRREERLRRYEEGVTVVRWCCHNYTGNEVSSCVGRVVERLQSLCV